MSESGSGCSLVSTSLDLQANVDTESELARLHSLIISHMDRLEDVLSKLKPHKKRYCLKSSSKTGGKSVSTYSSVLCSTNKYCVVCA